MLTKTLTELFSEISNPECCRYCSIAGDWANSSSLCTFQPGREEEGLVGEGPGLRLLPPPLQPTLVVPAVAPAVSRAIRVILLVLAAHHLALARDPDSAARRGGRVLQSHGGKQSRYILVVRTAAVECSGSPISLTCSKGMRQPQERKILFARILRLHLGQEGGPNAVGGCHFGVRSKSRRRPK